MANEANTCKIVLGTSSMEITREPSASNSPELIPKIQISGVYPTKINSKPPAPDDEAWKYRFDDIIMVRIAISDGTHFEFDLQEVTNQAGWTHDLAGQQQCVDDINTWLGV